jgi:hypothetical protein
MQARSFLAVSKWSLNALKILDPDTAAAQNTGPLGSRFVGGKAKEVSIILGSFPHRKTFQLV